jgi:hypothetical protein
MTPILARMVSAGLVASASLVNLPPCVAKAADRAERSVAVGEAGPVHLAGDAALSLRSAMQDGRRSRSHAASAKTILVHPRTARPGGQRNTASTSSRVLPRTA